MAKAVAGSVREVLDYFAGSKKGRSNKFVSSQDTLDGRLYFYTKEVHPFIVRKGIRDGKFHIVQLSDSGKPYFYRSLLKLRFEKATLPPCTVNGLACTSEFVQPKPIEK